MAAILVALLLLASPARADKPESRLGDPGDELLFVGSVPCQDEETGKMYVCAILIEIQPGSLVTYRVMLGAEGIYKVWKQIGDGEPEVVFRAEITCREPCT